MVKEVLKENLLFVYNANSGKRNAVIDSFHKLFHPETYDCKLCALTYGLLGEKQAWKQFRKRNAHQMEFLHKDEFMHRYKSKFGHKFAFPIILIEGRTGFEVVVSKEELSALETLEGLILLLEERL